MTGRYAIYNHRTNCWASWGYNWIEDNDTYKDPQNIMSFQTFAEAENYIPQITKQDYRDFYTIRKIYF